MQQSCEVFIDSLVVSSPALEAAYDDVKAYWEPDEPPTTTLFAALGEGIAEELGKGNEVSRSVSDQIEQAMRSDDENLVTAVATGLIESMVAWAGSSEDAWKLIANWLGEVSKRHAEAWRG